MKKLFTYSFVAALLSVGAPAFAEDEATPMLSFTVSREAVDQTMSFKLSLDGAGSVQIDWGEGELKSYAVTDYNAEGYVYTEITGTIAGPIIKIYGEDASKVNYLDFSFTAQYDPQDKDKTTIINLDSKIKSINVSQLSGLLDLTLTSQEVSTLDVSACTQLGSLYIENNNITNLTLPKSETLKSIYANNTTSNIGFDPIVTGGNQILGANFSDCPNLSYLNISGNDYNNYSGWWPEELNLSKNTKLTSLFANVCNLPEIDLANNTLLKTINLQCNKFTTLDLSNLDMATIGDGKVAAMLGYNQLESLKLPDLSKNRFMRLNLINNNFVFSTLPPASCVKTASNFVYSPQAPIVNPLNGNNIVDFSEYATLKVGEEEVASEFKWTGILDGATEAAELTEAAGQFTVTAPGVFRFNVPVKNLVGTITNEVYSKLTLTTTEATSVGLLDEILSFEVTSKEGANTINIGLIPTETQNVFVDWGDGEFDGPYEIEELGYDYTPDGIAVIIDGWDEICPKVKGSKIVIKGNPETIQTVQIRSNYTWGSTEANMAQITSIDLSKVTNLVKLSLDNNALTSIDLSKNPKLKKVNLAANKFTAFDAALPELTHLDISNQQSSGKVTFGENKIATLDYTKIPELIELTANACGLTPDFSKAEKLSDVNLMGNGYTTLAPVSASLTRMSLNYNELTDFDGTGLTAAAVNLFMGYNKLGAKKITLPAGANNVNIANNQFVFATLPALTEVKGTLTYNNQADVEVASKDGKVDLSSFAKVGETETVFTWAAGETAIEDADFTAADGVFTFKKSFDAAVCTMTNAAYEKLTLKTVPVAITASGSGAGVDEIGADENAPVEFFNLQGVKVANPENGIYIRRQGSKTQKVVIK